MSPAMVMTVRNRHHFESLGDFDKDLTPREEYLGFAVDIGAEVGELVGKIDAVILKPVRVRNAVPIHGWQVFASFTVDMKLDRNGLAGSFVDSAEPYALFRRADRLHRPSDVFFLQFTHRNRAAVRKMKMRVRV